MVRERGSGTTPQPLVDMLKNAISENGLIALEKKTGVGKSALSRYAKGKGEPTTATLQKLSKHFGVSVSELRGEPELVQVRFTGKEMLTKFKQTAVEISTPAETIHQLGIAVVLDIQSGASDEQLISNIRGLARQLGIKQAEKSGSDKVRYSGLVDKLTINPQQVIGALKKHRPPGSLS